MLSGRRSTCINEDSSHAVAGSCGLIGGFPCLAARLQVGIQHVRASCLGRVWSGDVIARRLCRAWQLVYPIGIHSARARPRRTLDFLSSLLMLEFVDLQYLDIC